MIPCHICGKDAGPGGRIKGFVPAPDSQKLALCPEHDTPENRKKLRADWHLMMLRSIRTATEVTAHQTLRGKLRFLHIQFTGGGSLNMPCVDAAPTDHGTLKVTTPEGALSFFPMQHIRRYDLSPLETGGIPEPSAPKSD